MGFNEVRPFDSIWAPLRARLELRQMFALVAAALPPALC